MPAFFSDGYFAKMKLILILLTDLTKQCSNVNFKNFLFDYLPKTQTKPTKLSSFIIKFSSYGVE